jgi:pimeloyl-ACP methyl ester carboxylesterase
MRARAPDLVGRVVRDGLALGYELYGNPAYSDHPTILLLPTWTIIHTRFWKLQVPYLARHFPVVVYDGPGNGASDRTTDSSRYAGRAYAEDAAAVLHACGVKRTVAVGLSRGALYAVELATLRPDLVAGVVLVGPALPVAPMPPARVAAAEHFLDPAPQHPDGWERYNLAYWHANYDDFTRWFFEQCFCEPHSTKAREDAVGWATETSATILEAEVKAPYDRLRIRELLAGLSCPTLVVHGDHDSVVSHEVGVETARLTNGTLVTFAGGGHIPNVRDPVRFNLLVREFAERVPP